MSAVLHVPEPVTFPLKGKTSAATWDAARRVYLVNGKAVPREKLRGWIQEVLSKSSETMKDLAGRRFVNGLTHSAWERASIEELKNLHTSLAVVANGGMEQMTETAWERLAEILRFQIDEHFLANFSPAVEAGMTEEGILARADEYANAGWGTYQNEGRQSAIESGDFDEELRVLSEALNCDTCLEQAGHWEAIGTLNDIGDSECLSNCQCEIIYRNSKTGDEV